MQQNLTAEFVISVKWSAHIHLKWGATVNTPENGNSMPDPDCVSRTIYSMECDEVWILQIWKALIEQCSKLQQSVVHCSVKPKFQSNTQAYSWSILLKLHSQWIICAAIKTSRHPFTCAAMRTHTLKPKFMDHFTESGFHGWWVSVCARTVNNRKLVVQLRQSGHLSPAENRNKSNNRTMNR